MNQEVIEFVAVGSRNPNVKGTKRLLVITHGSVVTRLEIKAEALGAGDAGGLLTLSDVTVPTPTFEQFRDTILSSALDKSTEKR
jgi:hypothetical protein